MIVYILCGIIFFQFIIHLYERKDLCDRIMSRNLPEYKGEKCIRVKSAHDEIIRRWRRKDGGQ